MTRWFVVVVSLLGLASAFWFKSPDWNQLRVTYSLNVLKDGVFDSLPRKESNAIGEGWTKIADCNETGQFQGVRYVKDNDYSVVLLFGCNGYIAGIQCGISKSLATSQYPPAKQIGNIFQDDGEHYTITAYFIDPGRICNPGRSADDFSKEGTGTGLYIQNGTDPLNQSVHIPYTKTGVNKTSWTPGGCWRLMMGKHYWYNVSEDMSCDDFQPVFLMYSGEELTGFGWAMGIGHNSTRFEHPTHRIMSAFIKPTPQCMNNYKNLSTMHVYMTSPYNDLFC